MNTRGLGRSVRPINTKLDQPPVRCRTRTRHPVLQGGISEIHSFSASSNKGDRLYLMTSNMQDAEVSPPHLKKMAPRSLLTEAGV